MSYKEHEGWKPHCTDGHQSTLTVGLAFAEDIFTDEVNAPRKK